MRLAWTFNDFKWSDFGNEETKVHDTVVSDLTIDSNDLMVFRDLSCLLTKSITLMKDVLGAILVNEFKPTHLAITITLANQLCDALTSKFNFSNIGALQMFSIKPGRLNAVREHELNRS